MMRVLAVAAMGLLTGCALLGGRGASTVAASEDAYSCAWHAVQGLGYHIIEEADPLSGAQSLVAERTLRSDAVYPVVAVLSVSVHRAREGTSLRVTGSRYEERPQQGGGARNPGAPARPARTPVAGPTLDPRGGPTVVRVGRSSSRGRMRLPPGPAEEDAAAVRAQCGRPEGGAAVAG